MKRKNFFFISTLIFVLISALFSFQPAKAASGDAQWAKSTVVAPDSAIFRKVTTDTDGNIYAVGYIYSNVQYNFGNSVTVTGVFADSLNTVIVKYNSTGLAQWARSTTTAPSYSDFFDVTTDSSGNVYAVGYIIENAQYNFGNSVTVTGGSAGARNPVIVKYNSAGLTQWARSTTAMAASNWSRFDGIKADTLDNIYAVGTIGGPGQFNFGNGATVTGAYADGEDALIVKYNSSGDAQWAKSTTVGPNQSNFWGVTADTSGNIYAVGTIKANIQFNFGNGATVTGAYNGDSNPLIVKYNSSGDAQWAKSTTEATNQASFIGVAIDTVGNIYAAGYNWDGSAYGFGNSVTVTGAAASGNTLLVKYNTSGDAQWAKSTTEATDYSGFSGVAADSSGNIYAAGYINSNGQFNFGNDVTATGAFAGVWPSNAVIVKYNSDGLAQWAKSTTTATDSSSFVGVAADANGNIYAAGYNGDDGTYGFGNSVTVTGPDVWGNAILVKYEGTGPIFTNLPGDSRTINIDEGQTITTNPYTIRVKPTALAGIDKVEFYIDNVLIGTDTTADGNGVYSVNWDTATYHSVVKVIAYDLNGYTATLTRSTNVSLTGVATLPVTGSEKTLEIILFFLIITGVGIYSFTRSKVKYY